MIKAITVKDIRTFAGEHRFPLRPLTLIIGPNNAGKSSLLACVRAVLENSAERAPKSPFLHIVEKLMGAGFGSFRAAARHGQPSFEIGYEVAAKPFNLEFAKERVLGPEPPPVPEKVSVFMDGTIRYRWRLKEELGRMTAKDFYVELVPKDGPLMSAELVSGHVLGPDVVPKDEGFVPVKHTVRLSIQGGEPRLTDVVPSPGAVSGNTEAYEVEEGSQVIEAWGWTTWYLAAAPFPELRQALERRIFEVFQRSTGQPYSWSKPGREFSFGSPGLGSLWWINLTDKEGNIRELEGSRDFPALARSVCSGMETVASWAYQSMYVEAAHLRARRAEPKTLFVESDGDVYRLLRRIGQLPKEEIGQTIRDWMGSLGLGHDILVTPVGDEGVEVHVAMSQQAENLAPLSSVGSGVAQIIPMLLYLATSSGTLTVEEPEANLHPAAQSRLADLFAQAAKAGKQTIIETHSEYLLRRLQILVAEGVLDPDLVQILYVGSAQGVAAVRDIRIEASGQLSQDLGPGFLDEATGLMLKLYHMNLN